MTWSAWIKPAANQPNMVIFRREGLTIGTDNGVPFVDIGGTRTSPVPALAPNAWHHLTVTAAESTVTLYIEGQNAATLNTPLPASTAPLAVGGDSNGGTGFSGEMDELEMSKTARPVGFVKFLAMSQSADKGGKLVAFANDETRTR
jgi:biopolymer transport protein ExbB